MTTETKQVVLYIHPEIKKSIYIMGANAWIQQQTQKYQPNLKIPPIPHQQKIKYRPRLTQETLTLLHPIPGKSTSQKVTNLYYNKQIRELKKQRRKEILHELFPQNPYY